MGKVTALTFCAVVFVSGLYAQAFNPVNGAAYPVEWVEWVINGEDRLAVLESNVRSSTVTFNPGNTVVNLGNALYKAAYTFFPDGTCEAAVKALFVQRSVSGTGRIERSGRDFTVFLSMRGEGERGDVISVMKGAIK